LTRKSRESKPNSSKNTGLRRTKVHGKDKADKE
jgi:hypothetical protein